MLKIVWKIKIDDNGSCLVESFKEAYSIYKEEVKGENVWCGNVKLYPVIISSKKFNNLKEFSGW